MPQQLASPNRVSLFGADLDVLRLRDAVDHLQQWIEQPGATCRYVVTPNVDHVVMLRHDPRLQAAYRHAAMVVADGLPLVLASRLLRKSLPERVAGSDLVPATLAAATPEQPTRAYLLGAGPGIADLAAQRIEATWPAVRVTGTYSPPMGFEHDPRENEQILERIADAGVDLLIIGLGAPKQELWVHSHQEHIEASVAVCAGATIDFLAGRKKRAPRWVQRMGMEWCHRMLSEPRRLVGRYARDAWVFPQLIWQEWNGWQPDTAGPPSK